MILIFKKKIIFATPKATENINNEIIKQIKDIEDFIKRPELKSSFDIEYIANDDFKEKIIDEIPKIAKSVADTSELFLRSYQLTQLFKDK